MLLQARFKFERASLYEQLASAALRVLFALKATPKLPFSLLTVLDVNDIFCEYLLGDFSFLHKRKFKVNFC